MEIQKLSIGHGVRWFRQAIDLGTRNPKAVFGAALLLLLTLYATALLVMLPAIGALQGTGTKNAAVNAMAMLGWLAPVFLIVLMLMPILFGGLMHVIREAEAGRPIGATALYAPFRQGKARTLAALGLVQLLFGVASALVVALLAGANYWHDYMAAMQAAMSGLVPAVPQPEHPGLLLLFQLLFNYFSYTITLFSVPLIMFSGQPLLQAIKLSAMAAVRNFSTNLIAGALFLAGVLVAALIVMLLAAFASLLGSFVHTQVGALLAFVVFMGFGVIVIVVLTGGAYFAWRDTFDGQTLIEQPFLGVEA
jgi:hypothetical protein